MKTEVRAKKQLGQHFLHNLKIAEDIAVALDMPGDVLEIGPGMGVLTQFLTPREDIRLKAVEIDVESVEYLKSNMPSLEVIRGDFLKMDPMSHFPGKFSVIGNFPYNISSQIFFRILQFRDLVPEIVCMLQKEVADRIVSGPTGREYGVLSVFLQAYYDTEYLFGVGPENFTPPPKVQSAVIRLRRNSRTALDCDEELFRKVVKGTFLQRRKTIRNSIMSAFPSLKGTDHRFYQLRPERLSVEDFIELTNFVSNFVKNNI